MAEVSDEMVEAFLSAYANAYRRRTVDNGDPGKRNETAVRAGLAAALEVDGRQPPDDEALAAEFRRGFDAGELNAALLHHAKTERLRAVADAAIAWRRQFEKPVKLPRMAALIAAVDALTDPPA